MNRRDELNGFVPVLLNGHSDNEADHFYQCPSCGQAVDMRKLGDVLHHEEPGHKPLGTTQ